MRTGPEQVIKDFGVSCAACTVISDIIACRFVELGCDVFRQAWGTLEHNIATKIVTRSVYLQLYKVLFCKTLYFLHNILEHLNVYSFMQHPQKTDKIIILPAWPC